MRKSELIAAIQKEILRHDFGTFVDNPPGKLNSSMSWLILSTTTFAVFEVKRRFRVQV